MYIPDLASVCAATSAGVNVFDMISGGCADRALENAVVGDVGYL